MADAVIDLEALLAPLPTGEGGAGEDLRADFSPASPYQKLRDARAEARAEERAQETATDGQNAVPAGWRDVRRLGEQILGEKSKDFEVAAWLAEALVRLEDLPGLTAAAQLIEGLASAFWEAGFPQQDEDGYDNRAAPLGGLAGEGADGTLMAPLRRMAMFRRGDGTPVGLHLWQAAEATAALADADRRQQRIKAGVPEFGVLENEARADGKYFMQVMRDAREAQRCWEAMDATLTERFGSMAPTTRRVSELLARILEIGTRLIGPIADDKPAADSEAEAVTEEVAADQPGAVAGAAAAPRALRTREDAIRQLEELADYFRRTEPHSPLAYTLDHAVRRARMPLADLLAEVVPDDSVRQAMLNMLGIKTLEGS